MTLRTIARWWWTLSLAVLVGAPLFAQDTGSGSFPRLEVSVNSPGFVEIGPRMGVLIDTTGVLTLEQARADAAPWQTIQRPSPNFGFTDATYWFRFQIDSHYTAPVERFIELPIPFIDDIRLYHFAGGGQKASYFLGDEKPFAQRVIRHRHFVMPVELAPGANQIYIRMASSGTIEASFRLWEPAQFHTASNDDNLVQGAVVGILLIMVVYNLFVYFSTRDINYLYYIGFVASYLFFHFTLTGYTYAYLWPEAVRWNSFAIATFIASSALFACVFTESFLKLRTFSRPAYLWVRALKLLSGLLLAMTFVLPYSLTVRLGAAITMPVAATALAVGYWRWWRGAQFARFYCLAWTAVLIGVGVLNASKLGWVPSNVWTNNASQIGIVLLVVLLSFTLADRINHDRTLRLNAQAVALGHERRARASQQALIQATTAANRELEHKVQSRTADLHAAMEQLRDANEQLQILSTTDGLTQVHNRAFFDTALATEYRRACRQGTALSLVMLDIDHFKQVNDSYGHMGGDACLRALAGLMRQKVDRAGDVLARYGGEEFVILLIGNDAASALALIEELRQAVERMEVPFEHSNIRFTASFGVAHGVPQLQASPQDFLASADKALYRAKQEGRNCVRSELLQL